MEQWKDVIGYEGLYQVSNLGRLRRDDRIKKVALSGDGRYYRTQLSKNNVKLNVYVHRIVAEAWLGPCPDGLQVLHGPSGNRVNSVGNLSYGTPKQNCLDKRRDNARKCNRHVVRSDGVEFNSMEEGAESIGCWNTAVSACCRGKRNKAGGYGWRYL